jgi:CheY-like chemotaxis protein
MAIATPKGSSSSVLIVDDDDLFQEILCTMLTNLGVTGIQRAHNGRQASRLTVNQSMPFDLCICDIFMPEMDGIEFVLQLARQGYRGDLILVSGGDPDLLSLAEWIALENRLNLLVTLTKPLTLEGLTQALMSNSAQSQYLTAIYPCKPRKISASSS